MGVGRQEGPSERGDMSVGVSCQGAAPSSELPLLLMRWGIGCRGSMVVSVWSLGEGSVCNGGLEAEAGALCMGQGPRSAAIMLTWPNNPTGSPALAAGTAPASGGGVGLPTTVASPCACSPVTAPVIAPEGGWHPVELVGLGMGCTPAVGLLRPLVEIGMGAAWGAVAGKS